MLNFDIIANWLLLAQDAAPGGGGKLPFGLDTIMLFAVIGLLFYFVLLQPERKRRRQHDEMLRNIKQNDRVLTVSGIYGTVVNVHKDAGDVTIKVDENTNAKIRITRSSIGQIVTEGGTTEKSGGCRFNR